MKVFTSLVLSAVSATLLSAAEIIPLAKECSADVTKGNIILTGSIKGSLDFIWKTKVWRTLGGSKKVMTKPGKDQWQFKTQTDSITGKGNSSVTLDVKKISADTVQYIWKWDAARKDAVGHFARYSVPIKDFIGKEISIDGTKVKVANVTKFGVYRKRGKGLSSAVKMPSGKTLTMKCEQDVTVLLATFKNGSMDIRFTPVKDQILTLTVSVK